jgi:HlyD family secretion protein
MKKKIIYISAAAIVIIIVLLVFKPFSKKSAGYSFETVEIEKGKISNVVTATGTIEAVTSVDVGTQVSGIIEKIYVDFNDHVKKGQLLALLDRKQLTEQLQQSKASLDMAEAQLAYEEATYNRLKALFDKKLIARSDFDLAKYNYDNAVASRKNAQSSHNRNKVNLEYAEIYSPIDGVVLNRAIEEGQTVAASFNTPTLFTIVNDLTQMEVETSVDEADIGKVKQNQRVEFTVDAYTDVKFDGKVTEVRLQSTTTNNVVTYSVILSAPNPDKKLMPGMTASATIFVEEKDSALMLSGKATRFNPNTDYLKKQFKNMKKNMPKNAKQGFPGQESANAGAAVASNGSSAITQSGSGTQIPAGGFTASAGGFGSLPEGMRMVWVKDGHGGIRPNPIKVGIDNGTYVEVLTGLKEGDEVVVSMSAGTKEEATKKTETPRGPFPF